MGGEGREGRRGRKEGEGRRRKGKKKQDSFFEARRDLNVHKPLCQVEEEEGEKVQEEAHQFNRGIIHLHKLL